MARLPAEQEAASWHDPRWASTEVVTTTRSQPPALSVVIDLPRGSRFARAVPNGTVTEEHDHATKDEARQVFHWAAGRIRAGMAREGADHMPTLFEWPDVTSHPQAIAACHLLRCLYSGSTKDRSKLGSSSSFSFAVRGRRVVAIMV